MGILKGEVCQCVIGEVQCDAVVTEVHSRSAEMSVHAVESGSKNADSYRENAPVLNIRAIITSNPLGIAYPFQTAINGFANNFNSYDPIIAAWHEFKRCMREAEAFWVTTGKEMYADMMIISLEDDRQPNDSMIFNMVLVQKNVAYTSTIDALEAKVEKETLKKKKKKGPKAAEKVEEEKGQSILKSIFS